MLTSHLITKNATREIITRAISYYDEANNECMHDNDEAKESTYIQYLGFNNQYRWVLLQPVPYSGFEYVEDIFNV